MTRGSQTRGRSRSRARQQETPIPTTTRLHELRHARGIGATEIARRIGISRQTIYAIEAGDFVPNTVVALQLARLLDVSVEDLFSIDAIAPDMAPANIEAELLATPRDKYSSGELVRMARVGSRVVAVPAPRFPTFLCDADGAILTQSKARATVRPIMQSRSSPNRLLVAGCDPALSLLSAELEAAETEVINVPCSSREALDWLKKGLVHVAGTHLRDRATGEYNLPLVTALFGKENVRVITFAEWEQGLVVPRGNPKRIRSVADLGQSRINIVNREKGSGARDLLDSNLRAAGISSKNVGGYDRLVPSHLAAALAVANSQADCCVATISAAKCLGLDFVPLSKERFDLIVASRELETPGIRILFDVLNRAKLRRKLAIFAGYETRHTGETLM
jgi:putative molybdopterin biosynthesis protein